MLGILQLIKCFLTLLIEASHKPPKFGERGGINFHWITIWFTWSIVEFFDIFNNNARSLFALTKLVALSEYRVSGFALRAQNRLRAEIKPSDDKSLTNSIWIALVVKQINKLYIWFYELATTSFFILY